MKDLNVNSPPSSVPMLSITAALWDLSDDPKQEYFADGMTDELITDLSKISGLRVISRNSSFTYKRNNIYMSRTTPSQHLQLINDF